MAEPSQVNNKKHKKCWRTYPNDVQFLALPISTQHGNEKLTGSPLDYHYFLSVFKKTMECKVTDSQRWLIQLLKYTEGEARKTIKHRIQKPVGTGYDRAKLLLEQCYGDPHRILAAYKKEIKGWPSVNPGNSSSYWAFHYFLIKRESFMARQ